MLIKHSIRVQENKMLGYIIFTLQRRSGIPKLRGSWIFIFQSATLLVGSHFIILGIFCERTINGEVSDISEKDIFSDTLLYNFNVKQMFSF